MSVKRKKIICFLCIAALLAGMLPVGLRPETVKAADTVVGYVDVSSNLNVRKGPGTSYGIATDINGRSLYLSANEKVTILGKTNNFYKVEFEFNGRTYQGYVSADYVDIREGTYDEEYAKKLLSAGFPESYLPALCYLHSKHPKWVFTPYITNLDWEKSLEKEYTSLYNMVPNSSIDSWKSTGKGAYNWETNTYTILDSGGWVAASKEVLAYYMDPRNFLTEHGIFMFEKLTYNPEVHNETGVNNILKGTFMDSKYDGTHTYASLFVEAGKKYNISPFMLAARARQEQGVNGTSGSVTGKVPGYEGIYNFFNFGAYKTATMDAVTRGLWYASQTDAATLRPWNSKYKSIMGGSSMIAKNYVAVGQNTLFLQKFNLTPTNTYAHQYMGAIQAPASEAVSQRNAYANLEQAIIFSIPVYKNMTEEPADRPDGYGNPNGFLKELNVSNIELTPNFSYDVLKYSVVVDYETDEITLSATPVASTTAVSGTGTKSLQVGDNSFSIVCTAGNGAETIYTLNVYRQGVAVTPTPEITPTEEPTPTPGISGELTPTPTDIGEITDTPTPTAGPANTPTPTVNPTKKPTPTVTKVPTKAPTKAPTNTPTPAYSISFGTYLHDSTGIYGIPVNTTVNGFFNVVKINGSNVKAIYDTSGKKAAGTSKLVTGYTLKTDKGTYYLSIKGDLSGDGIVNIKDLLTLKKYMLGSEKFSTSAKNAGRLSGTTAPGVKDLLKLKRYLLGLDSL
ncbi:MAG: cadherin-like beta sandwich domain-containing protein [Clostridiales bacterium]|nr:cadherin-like beta sandwich domain-containing protein [Clostridiales bacterium]